MKAVLLLIALLVSPTAWANSMRVVAMPGSSPLVTFKIVFLTGAASDPAGKPGTANLTAAMLARGGSVKMPYRDIVDAMFPMATSVDHQVDKEMTTFSAVTHVDNLDSFYELFRAMLLEPGWRAEDLKRLRDVAINAIRVNLRGNNDEELGKEVLYNLIYKGHPYGHLNMGTVSSLEKLALDDLKAFYRSQYTQANLILGIAGGYPPAFLDRVKKDFGSLPAGKPAAAKRPAPAPIQGLQLHMVEKNTRSVAISFGFPMDVRRGHPDFLPLLVMQSWLGQHRASGGRLYDRMREARGLNYGDYAYIEYFPNGMFQFEPDPNLVRPQQIFQVWIRPLEPPTAHFGLRLALFELDRMIRHGLTEEEFQRTRSFLSKQVNLLTRTKPAELGYAIDSLYYVIPDFNSYVKTGLAKLTRETVNQAIQKHLQARNMQIVVIASGCQELSKKLLAGEPSPMSYNSPKPGDILQEDKIVQSWKIDLKPENVRIVPVDQVFE
ncbi:MAG: insulinase family protein [Acidimicrobiia bacterium]|nr:insulinase family protein [Acidimicrobiia bacterium]